MSDPTSDMNWTSPDGQYLYDYTDKTWYANTYEPGFGDSGGYYDWEKCDPPKGLNPPNLQWSPNDANRPPPSSLPKGPGPNPPKVPGGKTNSGTTSVDTPSLDLFADHIKSLQDPVNGLVTTLKKMTPVQPGAFYHADMIRTNISGDNGDGGIQAKYHTALSDLGNGLLSVHNAVSALTLKYKTTEEANKADAGDVQKAFNGAQGYFSGVVSDTGGGGSPPGGS
ncbi:hypothetical protein ABH926_006761 [Catenulispora sp. GP43]|uniref:hypothetical protein n=1 Tax=Catenulispora sp. GP43 TaxID=3156263 RepID=UPI003517A85F